MLKAKELEQIVSEAQIKLPLNPFFEEMTGFGVDELLGVAVAVAGVSGTNLLLNLVGLEDESIRAGLMTASAPVIEKGGFFIRHALNAGKVYKTTVPEDRKPLSYYFKTALKGGMNTVLWDVIAHDPAYTGLLFGLLSANPQAGTITSGALAAFSFSAALLWAIGLQVGAKELMHRNYVRLLKKKGLNVENYYEARFLVDASTPQKDVLCAMQDQFELGGVYKGLYSDRYFPNKIPSYSGREPKLRLRKRTHPEGGWMQTAQITYTRARELKTPGVEQFRYFTSSKEKVYAVLKQQMPQKLEEIEDDPVRKALLRAADGDKYKDIEFERSVVHGDELLVSADNLITPHDERNFYIVELKVYRDRQLLQRAMRYLMTHFKQVHETTQGKYEIAANGK